MSDSDVCKCENGKAGCGYGYTCQLCQIQALTTQLEASEKREKELVRLMNSAKNAQGWDSLPYFLHERLDALFKTIKESEPTNDQ